MPSYVGTHRLFFMVNKGATVARVQVINAKKRQVVAPKQRIPRARWRRIEHAATRGPENCLKRAASLDSPSTSTLEKPGHAVQFSHRAGWHPPVLRE